MASNTLSQRLGFADPDLWSPEHDRMVTWLTEPEVLLCVLRQAWPETLAQRRAEAAVVLGLNDVPWERVTQVELEKPIVRDRGCVVGFVDLVAVVGWGGDDGAVVEAVFYLEVKPRITSVGSLLRQINLYRLYVSGAYWIVVSSSEQHRALLRDQGVALVALADLNRPEPGAPIARCSHHLWGTDTPPGLEQE